MKRRNVAQCIGRCAFRHATSSCPGDWPAPHSVPSCSHHAPYLKTLHSMFSKPSIVASSAIMSSTRFFWACSIRDNSGSTFVHSSL